MKRYKKRTFVATSREALIAFQASEHARNRRHQLANQLREDDHLTDEYLDYESTSIHEEDHKIKLEDDNHSLDISQISNSAPSSPTHENVFASSPNCSPYLQSDDEFIENLDVTGQSEDDNEQHRFLFDIKGLNLGINIPQEMEDFVSANAYLNKDYPMISLLKNLKKRRHKEWYRAFREFSKRRMSQDNGMALMDASGNQYVDERIDNLIKMFQRGFNLRKD